MLLNGWRSREQDKGAVGEEGIWKLLRENAMERLENQPPFTGLPGLPHSLRWCQGFLQVRFREAGSSKALGIKVLGGFPGSSKGIVGLEASRKMLGKVMLGTPTKRLNMFVSFVHKKLPKKSQDRNKFYKTCRHLLYLDFPVQGASSPRK